MSLDTDIQSAVRHISSHFTLTYLQYHKPPKSDEYRAVTFGENEYNFQLSCNFIKKLYISDRVNYLSPREPTVLIPYKTEITIWLVHSVTFKHRPNVLTETDQRALDQMLKLINEFIQKQAENFLTNPKIELSYYNGKARSKDQFKLAEYTDYCGGIMIRQWIDHPIKSSVRVVREIDSQQSFERFCQHHHYV